MSVDNIPISTVSDVKKWQTNEVIAQLKRIADALEAGNKMYRETAIDPFLPRGREQMPPEQRVPEDGERPHD